MDRRQGRRSSARIARRWYALAASRRCEDRAKVQFRRTFPSPMLAIDSLDATALALAFAATQLVAVDCARAWVYPEHRDIAVEAVRTLDPARKDRFDALWAEARSGQDKQLCAAAADAEQGTAPACIDWAALSAIA